MYYHNVRSQVGGIVRRAEIAEEFKAAKVIMGRWKKRPSVAVVDGDDSIVNEKADVSQAVLVRLTVAGPTLEQYSRVEVCGRSPENPRIFICTMMVRSFPNHEPLTTKMNELVAPGNCTKADLLKLKAGWQRMC